MPEEEHKMKMGKLKGELRGFVGKNFTRNISNAKVYVKIVLPNDKEKYYSSYITKHLENLMKKHPEFYSKLYELHTFDARPIGEDGTFELEVPLPVGDWKYIVSAHVEDDDYNHTNKMGSDGFGTRDEIGMKQFSRSEDGTIDGIVIPVKDRWWKPSEGTHKGDPKTKPKDTPPGRMTKEELEEMEEFLKDHGEKDED